MLPPISAHHSPMIPSVLKRRLLAPFQSIHAQSLPFALKSGAICSMSASAAPATIHQARGATARRRFAFHPINPMKPSEGCLSNAMELISHSLTQVLNLNPRAAACLSRLDGSPASASPEGRQGSIPWDGWPEGYRNFHLKR